MKKHSPVLILTYLLIALIPITSFAKSELVQEYQNMVILKDVDEMTDKIRFFFHILSSDDEDNLILLSFYNNKIIVAAPKNMFWWEQPKSNVQFRVDKGNVFEARIAFNEGEYQSGTIKAENGVLQKMVNEMKKGRVLTFKVNMLYETGRIAKFNLVGFEDMYLIYQNCIETLRAQEEARKSAQ